MIKLYQDPDRNNKQQDHHTLPVPCNFRLIRQILVIKSHKSGYDHIIQSVMFSSKNVKDFIDSLSPLFCPFFG